ncbi:hypothetical protein MMC29_004962 [Sticta canariensis]|nr:hypothetical protein [Sticta canariensis]
MNRFRGPSAVGQSKATPQTLCQKCLKRDNFECKATAQDRPYASRPSRTQQLANPKLIPKLTSDFPNELLRKKGIADEQLAKNEEERGRKRKAGENGHRNILRKRSRSISSYSSTSVSTISTNLSRSPHPSAKDNKPKLGGLPLDSAETRKRRRSSTRSSMSYSSNSSVDKERREHFRDAGRNIRRRRASTSPDHRGRDRNQSSVSSSSHTSESSFGRRRRDRSINGDFKTSRRRSSISPDPRGRDVNFYGKRSNRRTRSRSYSRDRSSVARNRQSMTPAAPPRWDRGQRTPRHSEDLARDRGPRYSNDNDRYGSSFRGSDQDNPRTARPIRRSQPESKARSLSPFSKRLALTQAMNMGN